MKFGAHRRPGRHRASTCDFIIISLALIAALSLSGCLALTGAGTPAAGTKSGSTTGTLAANATSFSFGTVNVGSSSSQTLTLTNSGTAAVMISQATVAGAGFSITGGMSAVSLAAGQSRAYQIQFVPVTAGSATGSISVNSSAANSPLSVSLGGTALTALAITAQPASQSVVAGQTATFAVGATGSEIFKYQWKKNGVTISGATSASYTTPATTSSDNGERFTVTIVDDESENMTSNPAILTVTAAPVAPTITRQPANQTIVAGQQANFSVAATGTATLAYQWKKNGVAISGATVAAYTTPAEAASDSGEQFSVTVSNGVGNVTSNAGILTVNVPPAIATQPVSQSVVAGRAATFNVTATGSGTLSYQWKKNGAAIGGATATSYTTLPTVGSDNGAIFTVLISNAAGNATSNPAILKVNIPATIAGQPANQNVIAGQTASFAVTASGTAPLAFQWNKNGIAIPGATSNSYTTPATTASDDGTRFTVSVANAAGTFTSNAAILSVGAATFVLNANQKSLTFPNVTTGGSSVLGVTFTNAGNSNVSVSGVSISGAGFAASGISSGQIVAPGKTVILNVTFAPAAAGNVTGAATVISNAAASPATITLSGNGVQVISHAVTLGWTASASTVSGYNVYRSSVTGGPYAIVNLSPVSVTTYVDSTVQSGQTYFYAATSIDSSGKESAFSMEATATIP